MQRAKAFFYVCAGLFLLAGAYALGARNASAQSPSNPVVAIRADGYLVVTANGDVYYSVGASPENGGVFTHVNNVFSGGPTPAKQESWGQVKARYR